MRPLMILAAGFGTRMGALTADRPKPLIPVAGRPLIDHALAVARDVHAAPVVVNLHYRAEMLAAHLEGRDVRLSWERGRILDTGGGLKAALPMLGPGPVFTLNADVVWTGENPLAQLATAWDPARMDALLLVLPAAEATGFAGTGDFVMDKSGRLSRAEGRPGVAYLTAQILDPAILADIPEEVFSMNRVWDLLIARGRAFGLLHRGGWCDVGSPAGLALAEAVLAR